jgi:hypothetical protein
MKNQTLDSPTVNSDPTTRLEALFGYNSNNICYYTFYGSDAVLKFVSDMTPMNLSNTLALSSLVVVLYKKSLLMMWHQRTEGNR